METLLPDHVYCMASCGVPAAYMKFLILCQYDSDNSIQMLSADNLLSAVHIINCLIHSLR